MFFLLKFQPKTTLSPNSYVIFFRISNTLSPNSYVIFFQNLKNLISQFVCYFFKTSKTLSPNSYVFPRKSRNRLSEFIPFHETLAWTLLISEDVTLVPPGVSRKIIAFEFTRLISDIPITVFVYLSMCFCPKNLALYRKMWQNGVHKNGMLLKRHLARVRKIDVFDATCLCVSPQVTSK